MTSSYSPVTIDFQQYSLTDGGTESTYFLHDLSTIFYNDWKFEDISTTDTGGLTAWNEQIEVISLDDGNWTIVRLSNKNGTTFSLNDFEVRAEGAGYYSLLSSSGYEYQIYSAETYRGTASDIDTSILDSNFSDISYVDFYSKAIADESLSGRKSTKFHLDDIDINGPSKSSPKITGPTGSAGSDTSVKSVNENETVVNTFTADKTVTWSLNGGADSSLFSINSSSGALSFSSTPDYDSPTDSDSDNNYIVVVRATDSANNTSDQTLTVSIANENYEESPTLSESSANSLLVNRPSTSSSSDNMKININVSQKASTVNQLGYLILESEANETLTYDLIQNSGKILFSNVESSDTPDLSAMNLKDQISLSNNQKILFFETTDTTFEKLLSTNTTIEGLTSNIQILNLSDITTSSATASNGGSTLSISSVTGSDTCNDEIFSDTGHNAFLDFSGQSGIDIEGTINIAREADMETSIGFYKIQNSSGSVIDPITGNTLLVGDSGYAAAALDSSNLFTGFGTLTVLDDSTASKSISSFTSTDLIAPYASVSDTNKTYFAFAKANSDGLSHFREFGNGVFGFEDQENGGDNDFDDLIIGFDFAKTSGNYR